LLVGCPEWDLQTKDIADDPIDDANVAYVSHLYPTHPRELWADAAELAKSQPVFVTEFGWDAKGGHAVIRGNSRDFGEPFGRHLQENGMSWTAFCFDHSIEPVMFDKAWNLLGGNQYGGEMIQSWLEKYKNQDWPPAPALAPAK
jgi:hypothetical protein